MKFRLIVNSQIVDLSKGSAEHVLSLFDFLNSYGDVLVSVATTGLVCLGVAVSYTGLKPQVMIISPTNRLLVI